MKRTLSYPELWRKKRNELPVKGNPDAGWLKMRPILDKQMPVSVLNKPPSRFKMPKWGLHAFVGLSLASAIYLGARLYLSKKHPDIVKTHLLQIYRDSVAQSAKDTLELPKAIKPAATTGTPGVNPENAAGAASITDRTKLNSGHPPKDQQQPIDSIKEQEMLNTPVHRDSLISPAEALPLKPAADPVVPVNLNKKDIQKDTSNNSKKPSKKKKRTKVSVFF